MLSASEPLQLFFAVNTRVQQVCDSNDIARVPLNLLLPHFFLISKFIVLRNAIINKPTQTIKMK